MVQEKTPRKPSHREVARGHPTYDTYYVRDNTSVTNGRLVQRDTNDASIKIAGNECRCALGWVAREKTNSKIAKSNRTDIYAVGDYVGVVKGDITVVGRSAEAAITKADLLVCASAGRVKKWATGDDERMVVGRAAETITAAEEILIESNLR